MPNEEESVSVDPGAADPTSAVEEAGKDTVEPRSLELTGARHSSANCT